jgi:hypothetical protein
MRNTTVQCVRHWSAMCAIVGQQDAQAERSQGSLRIGAADANLLSLVERTALIRGRF